MTARPIYYDTETTGIKAETNFIIEIAAYDPVRDKTYEQLINPGCPIPPEATAVHKITDEMVASAPTFKEMLQDFVSFCDDDVILVAHNNDGFDIHFLRAEFERSGSKLPEEWRFFDTLKWARRYRRDLPKHSLQFLREIYGVEANNAHRALDDVIVMHKIFSKMLDDLTIEQAFHLLNKPRAIHHMPFGKHQGTPLKEMPKNYVTWLKESGCFDKAENKELQDSFVQLGLLTK